MRSNLLQIGLLIFLFLFNGFSRSDNDIIHPSFEHLFTREPLFLQADERWADSVMDNLTLDERIGQMIMIYGYSNMGEAHRSAVLKQIKRYGVGGILFFQGEPLEQARLTNLYQEASEVPLLVAIDGENGLGMRLKNTITYPSMMTLGAISDNSLIYRLGQDIAEQCESVGVHMNLAPVADINNNPSNPVIGTRSFGEDRRNVAQKVVAMVTGMQSRRLLVAAKHFPGHGDTGTDSHYALPVITHPVERLDSVELFPFREAIARGLSGIMVAHLQVPALDQRENRPTSLSRPAVTGLLKEKMGFRGLVISDALNMKGLSNWFEPGVREVEAVKAGNDILLMPHDVNKAITFIRRAVKNGEIPAEAVNKSCRKILQAKYWVGLHHRTAVRTDSLLADLKKPAYYNLYRDLAKHALILLKNDHDVIPLKGLDQVKLATVTIGRQESRIEGAVTDLYLEGSHFFLSSTEGEKGQEALLSALQPFNTVIVNVLSTSTRASRKYGISDATVRFLAALDTTATLILNVAGVPYALSRFPDLDHMDAVILSHNSDSLFQHLAMQGIFGGIPLTGTMPVSAGKLAKAGDGIRTGPAIRFEYAQPFDAGLNEDTLRKMEGIIQHAIREKAMPGCQVLVARHGKVVWNRAWGYHTYQKRRAVRTSDIYDLASITKVVATTAALMKLREQGKFHEDSVLAVYDPIPDSSNKAQLKAGDVLSHHAGLEPWIPFYLHTLEPLYASQHLISNNRSYTYPYKIGNGSYANRHVKYVDGIYRASYSEDYPVQVAENLYMRSELIDSVYHWIHQSELLSREYRYSGLGFHLFHQIIESITDTSLADYVRDQFYAPLGATTLGYKPLERFSVDRIVPTENDLFFRRQLLQGHVHDMGAAMLGGVSGNAGLFSDANDLAKMMQMFLNGGNYGGKQFLEPATLALYTACYHCDEGNRRGLGFDRPLTDEPDAGPACNAASSLSYGHSGFTGTLTWVDPAYDLVYVFLSNRVHPDMGNNKLIEMNVRTDVQQVIYDAIIE